MTPSWWTDLWLTYTLTTFVRWCCESQVNGFVDLILGGFLFQFPSSTPRHFYRKWQQILAGENCSDMCVCVSFCCSVFHTSLLIYHTTKVVLWCLFGMVHVCLGCKQLQHLMEIAFNYMHSPPDNRASAIEIKSQIVGIQHMMCIVAKNSWM